MKLALALLVCLLARPYYVTAGEPCGPQPDYRRACPYSLDPNWVAVGPVLPAGTADPNDLVDPNDPARWNVPVGKLNRVGRLCNPGGWRIVDVNAPAGSSRAAVTFDQAKGVWTLAAEVRIGLNWWIVRAVNEFGKEKIVVVTGWGTPPEDDAGPVVY